MDGFQPKKKFTFFKFFGMTCIVLSFKIILVKTLGGFYPEIQAKEVGGVVIFVYDIFRPFLYISVVPSTISKVP